MNVPCPCGSNIAYASCCGRLIDAGTAAPDAEALMRSRFTAYSRGMLTYLLETWHPDHRPPADELPTDTAIRWLRLKVLAHHHLDTSRATVRFQATYKLHGRAHRLDEHSRFLLEGGRWLYLDGHGHLWTEPPA